METKEVAMPNPNTVLQSIETRQKILRKDARALHRGAKYLDKIKERLAEELAKEAALPDFRFYVYASDYGSGETFVDITVSLDSDTQEITDLQERHVLRASRRACGVVSMRRVFMESSGTFRWNGSAIDGKFHISLGMYQHNHSCRLIKKEVMKKVVIYEADCGPDKQMQLPGTSPAEVLGAGK